MKKPNIVIYDNGGITFDRYTCVYLDEPEHQPNTFAAVGMSEHPFHPQGFGQHCSAQPGRHLGLRIGFYGLPPDCQRLVLRDLRGDPDVEAPRWWRDMMDARALATHMTGGPA